MKSNNEAYQGKDGLNEKMDKILKVVGIIGIVLVVFSLIAAFFGFLLSSEDLFYTGISLIFFVLPAYFVVFLLIFIVAVIIEKKTK